VKPVVGVVEVSSSAVWVHSSSARRCDRCVADGLADVRAGRSRHASAHDVATAAGVSGETALAVLTSYSQAFDPSISATDRVYARSQTIVEANFSGVVLTNCKKSATSGPRVGSEITSC
jgi:hypothetical protein